MFTQRKHYAGQLSIDAESDAKSRISPWRNLVLGQRKGES